MHAIAFNPISFHIIVLSRSLMVNSCQNTVSYMAVHPDVVYILILGFYGGEQRGVLPHWYLISSSLIADRQQHLCLCVNWWGNEKCPHRPHGCHCCSVLFIQQRISTDHSHSGSPELTRNEKHSEPDSVTIRVNYGLLEQNSSPIIIEFIIRISDDKKITQEPSYGF